MNLFCGFYATIAVINEKFSLAAVAILLAVFFDALDGIVARFTRSCTDFGVEYDSLADLISFGIAPGLLLYWWALKPFGRIGWMAAFLFVICGALRLARFNVMSRYGSNKTFTGLPIPAAAGVIASIVIMSRDFFVVGETNPLMIALISYFLAFLMVSNFKYRSFKHLHLKTKKSFSILVFTTLLVFVVALIPEIMLFAIFIAYALSGPSERALIYGKDKVAAIAAARGR